MSIQRLAPTALATVLLILLPATDGWAQVCMGLPTGEGQMSIQGEIASTLTTQSYGGRLAMNFNTEYTLDFSLRRPRFDPGQGLVLSAGIGYQMEEYRPPVCFMIGVRHAVQPMAEGPDSVTTMVPIAVGVGKRLGSAKGISLALFVIPEYIVVASRVEGAGEFEDFWDELRARSEGRGVLGLILATPFIFATGGVEIGTQTNFEPTIALGLGLTF